MIGISFLETIKGIWVYIIKPFWWVWVIAIGIGLLPRGFDYLAKWLEERRLKKWLEKHKKLEEWKKVDGRKFEKIVAIIFEGLGYKTKVVGGPRDKGIDIIAKKDGNRFFFQCKRMEKVKPSDILAFSGALSRKKLKK